jgi:hypothetical protein
MRLLDGYGRNNSPISVQQRHCSADGTTVGSGPSDPSLQPCPRLLLNGVEQLRRDPHERHLSPTIPAGTSLSRSLPGIHVQEPLGWRSLGHGAQQGRPTTHTSWSDPNGEIEDDQRLRAFTGLDEIAPAALHRPGNTRRRSDDYYT